MTFYGVAKVLPRPSRMIISNIRITLCTYIAATILRRQEREREVYVTTAGPERGHMAADATEKRL